MPVLSLACHLPHNTPHIYHHVTIMNKQQNKQKLQTTHIYINISCKCDTNRAGHLTLDAYASRPVACYQYCCYPNTSRSTKLKGVCWFHHVRLSVCGQNRVHSVSSIILTGSISYLPILLSNFRRCVTHNVLLLLFSKFKHLKISANSLNL